MPAYPPPSTTSAAIATHVWNNTTGSAVDVSTNSTSPSDVDATNMAVTFTAPATGAVVVIVSGMQFHSSDQTDNGYWVLRSGSTAVGNTVDVTNTSRALGTTVSFPVSGLTPGASVTLKLAHFTQNSPTAQHFFVANNTAATMTVLAA